MFDPTLDIPTTDEEAKIALRHGKSELAAVCLVGLFKCYRADGLPLLEAYKRALLASVGETQEAQSA
jgi:hypothetical protein